MSIISALKNYLKTNPSIPSQAPVWVDYMENKPTQFSILTLPGNQILEEYIDGSSRRVYPFAIQSIESTADELERLENSGFYEDLSEWFEEQSEAGTLPDLGTGKTAERIEMMGWGYLFQTGESQTGIYQIQCRLIYEQSA